MNFIAILMLFNICNIFQCSLTVNKVPKRELLQKCVDKIQKLYFKPADYMIYLNLEHKLEHLKFRSNPIIIQTSASKILTSFRLMRADVYLMEIRSKNTSSVFKRLAKSMEWNPRAKFVIIVENIDKMLFPTLRILHVLNVIVLLNSEIEIQIFTYFPYDNTREIGDGEVLMDTFAKTGFRSRINLFPNKLPSLFHNFTVKLGYINYPPYIIEFCSVMGKPMCGIELDVMEMLQDRLGFNVSYIKHNYQSWGSKENGKYLAGSSGLIKNEFDAAVGAYLPNSSQIWDFDLTFPYFGDTLNWVVPLAKIEPLGNSLSAVYTYMVWITIGISYCTISLSYYFINLHKRGKQELSKFFFLAFQCLLGQALNRQPKFWYNRILFIVWVYGCYIISSYFQSKVIVGFKFESYGKQITTPQEMMESKIEIGFYSDGGYMFSDQATEFDKYVYNNYQLCSWSSNCTRRVAYERDFATIKFRRFLEFAISTNYKDDRGIPLLYIMKDHVVRNAYICIAFAKGFPIFDEINNLLMRLYDNGCISRYYDLMTYYKEMGLSKSLRIRISDTLQLESVAIYFNFLILGWLLAFIVFILENIRHYFKITNLKQLNRKFNYFGLTYLNCCSRKSNKNNKIYKNNFSTKAPRKIRKLSLDKTL